MWILDVEYESRSWCPLESGVVPTNNRHFCSLRRFSMTLPKGCVHCNSKACEIKSRVNPRSIIP